MNRNHGIEKGLECFLDDMERLQNSDDKEMAHRSADDILVELIKHLGSTYGNERELNEIMDAYNRIDKWYA